MVAGERQARQAEVLRVLLFPLKFVVPAGVGGVNCCFFAEALFSGAAQAVAEERGDIFQADILRAPVLHLRPGSDDGDPVKKLEMAGDEQPVFRGQIEFGLGAAGVPRDPVTGIYGGVAGMGEDVLLAVVADITLPGAFYFHQRAVLERLALQSGRGFFRKGEVGQPDCALISNDDVNQQSILPDFNVLWHVGITPPLKICPARTADRIKQQPRDTGPQRTRLHPAHRRRYGKSAYHSEE